MLSPYGANCSVWPVWPLCCDLLCWSGMLSKSQCNSPTGPTERFTVNGLNKPSCAAEQESIVTAYLHTSDFILSLFCRSLVTRLASSGVQEGLLGPLGANRSVWPVWPLCCDLLGAGWQKRAGPGPGRDPVAKRPDTDHLQSVAAPRSRHIPGTRRPYTRRQVSQHKNPNSLSDSISYKC